MHGCALRILHVDQNQLGVSTGSSRRQLSSSAGAITASISSAVRPNEIVTVCTRLKAATARQRARAQPQRRMQTRELACGSATATPR